MSKRFYRESGDSNKIKTKKAEFGHVDKLVEKKAAMA
jgi:hypothetical protein